MAHLPLSDDRHFLTNPFASAGLSALGLVGLILLLLPFGALIWIAIGSSGDAWGHLAAYVIPAAAWDTGLLLLLVAIGTGAIGAGAAWLTTLCRFPGRRFFSWALVLPLAVPVYIAAYSQVELFDHSGVLQSTIRTMVDRPVAYPSWLPGLHSVWGAAYVFTVVLYPYAYLTVRLVFSMQGASAIEIARSLGASPTKVFFRIALPMARPAVAIGVALALMEVLNDIGAVEILGVRTISFAVYETWLNRDDLGGAVQLALLTLLIVALLLTVERRARNTRNYAISSREKPPALIDLTAPQQLLAIIACSLPIVFGLIVPVLVLGRYALRRLDEAFDPAVLQAMSNSLLVAVATGLLATAIAYLLVQSARMRRPRKRSSLVTLATLGYAVPGTVLALGLLVPLAAFDNWFSGLNERLFGFPTGLLISGSAVIVVYACTIRFLAISHGAVDAGAERISDNMDMAARALGRTRWQMARQVHMPILQPAMIVAFLLVFVDTMKELSATLLLRPFGFETLATFIYARASQAAVEEAGFASLIIVAIGLVPVIVLTHMSDGWRKKTRVSLPA